MNGARMNCISYLYDLRHITGALHVLNFLWENFLEDCMCAQRTQIRPRMRSLIRVRRAHYGSLRKTSTASGGQQKTQIRLRERAGWSESSLAPKWIGCTCHSCRNCVCSFIIETVFETEYITAHASALFYLVIPKMSQTKTNKFTENAISSC